MPWYAWWLLLASQMVLFAWIAILSGKIKKADEGTSEGREDKILRLYNNIEEMLDSFEEYVGEVHTQLEEKRTELIELNRQAQVVYLQVLDGAKQPEPESILNVPPQPQKQPPKEPARKNIEKKKREEKRSRLSDGDRESLGRFATKPQKVRFLMSRGLSVDEVARELDIGKGEVLLIADLDKT